MNKKLPDDHISKPPTKPAPEPEFPPPEEELGGGDFCSLDEQPSSDDDKPLD